MLVRGVDHSYDAETKPDRNGQPMIELGPALHSPFNNFHKRATGSQTIRTLAGRPKAHANRLAHNPRTVFN